MIRQMLLIELIATCVQARLNCIASDNAEWESRHEDTLQQCADLLPSGSGFDSGTKIDLDASKPDRIVLHTAFHHLSESGMYDGWTDHTITVLPAFIGRFDLRISGRDRNDIKDYIADTFDTSLKATVERSESGVRWIPQAA